MSLPPPPPPTPLYQKWFELKLVRNENIVYGNLKSGNSQDLAPDGSTKLYIHEFGFSIKVGGDFEELYSKKFRFMCKIKIPG
jgi:hypothetical protein